MAEAYACAAAISTLSAARRMCLIPCARRRKSWLRTAKRLCISAGMIRLLGVIAVADVIKEDSPQAVRELQDMGVHVVMLTGDNERTARAIGAQAGVDRGNRWRAA